jgi:hypothetical protein
MDSIAATPTTTTTANLGTQETPTIMITHNPKELETSVAAGLDFILSHFKEPRPIICSFF